jgi:hypothetical protein
MARRRRRSHFHWYSRFGIEAPFPWVGIAIWTVPIVGAVAGAAAVVLALLYGGDDTLASY